MRHKKANKPGFNIHVFYVYFVLYTCAVPLRCAKVRIVHYAPVPSLISAIVACGVSLSNAAHGSQSLHLSLYAHFPRETGTPTSQVDYLTA